MSVYTLADGQVAATATALLTATVVDKVTAVFQNISGSTETVVITLQRSGGTARRVAYAVLSTNEQLIVKNLPVQSGDILLAVTTDASSVDYVVFGQQQGEFGILTLDANGALKSGSAAFSGNVSVTGNLTATTGSVTAGQSGTAGTLTAFAGTASKGKATITTSDNTGNTTTNLNFAAQAGARTITVPDAGASSNVLLSAQTESSTTGLFAENVPLTRFRNTDGSTLAAAAAAGKFGQSITLGTSQYMVGEAAQGNTKTDDAIVEYTLPPWYKAGTNLTVTAYVKLTGTGTAGTKTAQILAYRNATTGLQGADIGPGSTTAITAAGADISATITGTTLAPGDKITFELEIVLQETGASNSLTAQVGSFRVT